MTICRYTALAHKKPRCSGYSFQRNSLYIIIIIIIIIIFISITIIIIKMHVIRTSDDEVYMHDTNLLQEYVLKDSGVIFRGSQDSISWSPWTFEQVCMKMLARIHE